MTSHDPHSRARYAEFVLKVSKFCNLRCKYCYEYPSLGDRRSMSLEELRLMFANIARSFEANPRRLDFVWHGGEPLLISDAFYHTAFELQQAAFGPVGLEFTNAIQTNLTVLNRRTLALLRQFAHVGVSVDLFGGNRVNRRGLDSQPRVLTSMQRLLDEGVRFGCITVLSRSTIGHVRQICQFFDDLGISFRLLPIYRSGFSGQLEHHELTPSEIVTALCIAADYWFAANHPIQIEPIDTYLVHVVHRLLGNRSALRQYDKGTGELVFIVDTDGSVYSNGDAYDRRYRHGNLFNSSLTQMKNSDGYQLALIESRDRVKQACVECSFYGSCSGFYVAEATPEQRWRDESGLVRCGVAQPMLEYLTQRIGELGLVGEDGALELSELRSRATMALAERR